MRYIGGESGFVKKFCPVPHLWHPACRAGPLRLTYPLKCCCRKIFLFGNPLRWQPHHSGTWATPLRGLVGAIPGRIDLKDVYLWKGGQMVCAVWSSWLETGKVFWEQAGYHNEADIWKEQRVKKRPLVLIHKNFRFSLLTFHRPL